ncbi:hypothetical protein [Streptomyces sp. FH025]|uniref:hypothetical protein n=1 Tax=Streptomyces sp. FH025 TaxID=2815937 RepID=UPI001A9EE0B5|nr:hypothetical protein [Streptomyces sp. FH025]MBO1415090.1 hypothetical protein [Streptomyces sp. FH025]
MPGASSTLLAGGRLLWVEPPASRDGHSTIRSGATDGSGAVDLLPASAPDAPRYTRLTASDQAVTFTNGSDRPTGGWTNAALPKLWQIPLTGGTPQRVSCNRGGQYDATADRGTRVLWLDSTTGRTNLATREHPAGTC